MPEKKVDETQVLGDTKRKTESDALSGVTASLVILDGENAGNEYAIEKPKVVLGREGAGTDVVVGDAGVSRHHAQIEIDADGSWTLRDLGSTNGTVKDGKKIDRAVELRHGEKFTVGQTSFQFLCESKPRGGKVYEIDTIHD